MQLESLKYLHLASLPNVSLEVIYLIQREIRDIRKALDLPYDFKVANTNTTRYMPVILKVSMFKAFLSNGTRGIITNIVESIVTLRQIKELKEENKILDEEYEEDGEDIDYQKSAEKECAQ